MFLLKRWTAKCLIDYEFGLVIVVRSTLLNRATSGPGCFDPIKQGNLLTENIVIQTGIPSYKSCEKPVALLSGVDCISHLYTMFILFYRKLHILLMSYGRRKN